MRILHRSNYVASKIDKFEYPHLIQKYSDEWTEMVKESVVTDQVIGDSLGLSGTKNLNKYVVNILNGEGMNEDYFPSGKSTYEIDEIATVASIFMPALLPSCAVLYKEGCSFIESNIYKRFLCVSPLSVIRYYKTP